MNAVNAMLRNTKDEARLKHHPRCLFLRKDLENIEWKEGGAEINKKNPDRTHASDALGYFIESEFQLTVRKPDPVKRFYK